MAYVSSTRTASTTLGARLSEMVKQTSEAYTTWRTYRRTLTELRDLSIREMDDLGLNPTTLRQAAYEAVYGKLD